MGVRRRDNGFADGETLINTKGGPRSPRNAHNETNRGKVGRFASCSARPGDVIYTTRVQCKGKSTLRFSEQERKEKQEKKICIRRGRTHSVPHHTHCAFVIKSIATSSFAPVIFLSLVLCRVRVGVQSCPSLVRCRARQWSAVVSALVRCRVPRW